MARARNLAVAAAAGMTISAGLLASPAQAATDSFTLCAYPLNCSAASVSGSVNWDTNVLSATAVNNSYSSVTVTVTRASTTTRVTVLRGGRSAFTGTIAATDPSVQVRLCPAATTCTSVTLTRH
ncbi:hypothetical protein [Actinoplanes xinjiangensis]|uniref:Uncharacterized protein n=1 Tax=Actinoplanes xinjiangensis TaxID=512350 RepID=A0A316FS19_9ACTN|nr:hypothetical protein [Actinoplanes xinjiangensis]PWK51551.1 hypothetical protein BC793_102581 [Actinoplanes xinjiangensis]GIF35912.1 hypothetical protein Axi01nite_02230 [Actinoplanes xinjiangensis]